MVHSFNPSNPSTPEAEAGRFFELEDILIYIAMSRTARATERIRRKESERREGGREGGMEGEREGRVEPSQ